MEPLTCKSCSRHFSSVSTLERHILRCRFRPRNRKKACAECSRSKVRCDQGAPACSRCAVHTLACVYPHVERTEPAFPLAAASPSPLAVSLPLTPSSDLPQSHWTPVLGQGPYPLDPSALLSITGWVQDRDSALQMEGLPFLDNCGSEGPLTVCSRRYGSNQPLGQALDPDSFRSLSTYLGGQWTTAEQGLDLIDRVLKSHVDLIVGGLRRPPFVHFNDWEESRRSAALAEAVAVAQLYASRTPQSDSLLLRSIDAQLVQAQRTMGSHTRADDVATMQTTLLYSTMRIYRAGPNASECIDRVPLRLMQHILSKNLHCMTPHTTVNPSDWESWIQDESLRRSFFVYHALDYVAHARQSLPTVFCALFPDTPLPCPSHIWEAPTDTEWSVRYRAWEDFCGAGGPLRYKTYCGGCWGKRLAVKNSFACGSRELRRSWAVWCSIAQEPRDGRKGLRTSFEAGFGGY